MAPEPCSSNSGAPPPPGGALSADALVRILETGFDISEAESAGTRIGPYKLLQEIGKGGFGTGWMAEQQEPIRRRVALKIIKAGMDTHEVIARFEAERQALALMDHPNIARVLEAGATEHGRPYFVMELVRGVAITRYCDDNRLPAEARLRLLMSVCQAVQHAHQKGVIHRDLKPSNILVTLHDGVAVPKIIDFGIAKATNAHLADRTLFTQFHAFIGTPAYTSPEQIEMSGLDVDTRSDIYSLGILLYELLTGRPPFDSAELVKSGLEAMRRTIREIDPPRPSTRLNTLDARERTTIAQHRSTDATKLSLLLRGDLDWVVMHCLEKDRTRRYATAIGLAADIDRYLHSEPVSARPPSQLYRLRKFIRRHKLGFAASAAVLLSLVAGLTTSSVLYLRERTAAAKSAHVAQFMKAMLNGVGPAVARGRDTTMLREILDDTARRLASELHNQPEVAADLLDTLGMVYHDLGQDAAAEPLLRDAAVARRALPGNNAAALATSLDHLGVVFSYLGRAAEAEVVLQQAFVLRLKEFGREHPDVATSLDHISHVPNPGRTPAAVESMRREALTIRQKFLGNDNPAVADSLVSLGDIAWDNHKIDECIALHRQALAMRRSLLGEDHPDFTQSLYKLGYALEHAGQIEEAGERYREAFTTQRSILGDGHPAVLDTLLQFAGKSAPENRREETIATVREFVANQRALLGPEAQTIAPPLLVLSALLHRQDPHSEEARTCRSEARALLETGYVRGHPINTGTIRAMGQFAWSNVISGTPADGLAMAQEAHKLTHSLFDAPHLGAVIPTRTLAWIYFSTGQFAEAKPVFEEAIEIEKSLLEPAMHRLVLLDIAALGSAHRRTGHAAESRAVLEAGLVLVPAYDAANGPMARAAAGAVMCELGYTLNNEGHFPEAEAIFRQALARYELAPPQLLLNRLHPRARVVCGLGQALAAQGRFTDAEPLFAQACQTIQKNANTLAGDRSAIVREVISAAARWRTDIPRLPPAP